jgi:hypothetical protein
MVMGYSVHMIWLRSEAMGPNSESNMDTEKVIPSAESRISGEKLPFLRPYFLLKFGLRRSGCNYIYRAGRLLENRRKRGLKSHLSERPDFHLCS